MNYESTVSAEDMFLESDRITCPFKSDWKKSSDRCDHPIHFDGLSTFRNDGNDPQLEIKASCEAGHYFTIVFDDHGGCMWVNLGKCVYFPSPHP